MTLAEEIQAVTAAQQGNAEAFQLLFRTYRRPVVAYCSRMFNNRVHDAEDTAQEIFLRAFERLSTLDHPSSFRYWLFTIARNEVFGRLRKARGLVFFAAENLSDELTDDDDPLESLVLRDRAMSIQEGIEQLKPAYREALHLREFEGLSYIEIAAITGITEAAVKSRLFKARKALAGLLEHLRNDRSV